MKHSPLLFSIMSFAVTFVTVTALFLITVSISFAQTAPRLQPGTIDVGNTRSERSLDAPKELPRPTLYEDTHNVREVDVQKRESKENIMPRTFLEKARSVLQEKRQETTKFRNTAEDNHRDDELKTNEERRVSLNEQKGERISRFLDNIKRKMDAAILRLETLTGRLESRIIKFEERDLDMTEARRLLEVAKDGINGAIESIDTAFNDAKETLSADGTRDSFGGVVSELSKAKENLRNAHSSLVEVIRIMKASISNDKKESPSTNTEETETTN